MERLIAKRAVLYQGRQYEPGEPLPAYDTVMVDAWLRAGTAEMVSDTKPEETLAGDDNGQNGQDGLQNGQNGQEGTEDTQDGQDAENGTQDGQDAENGTQDGQGAPEMVEGHLDPAQLESMSKEALVALAKDMGVELPRGAAKALIVEKLAAVTVQAPVNDGSAQ